MSTMKYKVILFDHDDTLVRTLSSKWAQHKYIAKKYYNKELSEEELHKHWGKPLSTLLKELYETNDLEKATYHNVDTRHIFPKTLFADTNKVLSKLQDQGIVVGVVTATSKASIEYDFSTLEIEKNQFDYIQTQEDTPHHKPNPRVFDPVKLWLAENNFDWKEVLYVGDALTDMEAAQGAGFDFMGKSTGLVSAEEFAHRGVPSLPTLEHLLAKL